MNLALPNTVPAATDAMRSSKATTIRASRIGTMNQVGTDSTPSLEYRGGLGTRWNASLPGSRTRRQCAGFTLVEIAICLAVVAFALVAIIGVLPRGLTAQRDNRTETIINQDAQVWMETLKDSFRGADQLMNHVELIVVNGVTNRNANFYGPGPDRFTTAEEIVGLLATPDSDVFADVIAISGPAVEKAPAAADVAFKYRMRVQVDRSRSISPTNAPGANFNYLRNHLYDIRLRFRWPVVGASPGNQQQTYRMQTEGILDSSDNRLWFFTR